jgi:hypothetical protein
VTPFLQRLSSRRFGVVWAFLIFNLIGFIVSTIRKRDQVGILQATPESF